MTQAGYKRRMDSTHWLDKNIQVVGRLYRIYKLTRFPKYKAWVRFNYPSKTQFTHPAPLGDKQ